MAQNSFFKSQLQLAVSSVNADDLELLGARAYSQHKYLQPMLVQDCH